MVAPQDGEHGEDDRVQELGHGKITGTDYSAPMPPAITGGPRLTPEPKEPSAAEIARHMLTHLPFCGWCKYCVAGRKPNAHHRRQRNERSIPFLSCDYGFFRDPGEALLTSLW